MAYKIITQPSVEPVTLEYVKARSRIDAHYFEWAFLSFYTETNREIL